MHPSRTHQSTKKPDDGLNLGFSDIGAPKQDPLTTPSKINMPANNEFEFRFARPTESLGPEAQQMMADIREEAKRIKAELQAKHEEEKAKSGSGMSSVLDGRKFAQPKGKAGRYSELHMNEFKKMDSIADHPSAFRAQPGRALPVANQTQKSLKRTQSKADLREDEDNRAGKSTITSISDRRNDSSPSKRARQTDDSDASTARPLSSQGSLKFSSKMAAPSTARSTDKLESFALPPSSTKPAPLKGILRSPSKIVFGSQSTSIAETSQKSLLRSPSKTTLDAQPSGTAATQHKSLLRSPSKATLDAPSVSTPETSHRSLLRSPSKATLDAQTATAAETSHKSLLRSPSKTTLGAQSAGTGETSQKSLLRSPSKVNITGQVNSSAETPQKSLLRSPSKVNLGPSTITTPTQASLARAHDKHDKQNGNPATGIPRLPSKMNLATPSKPASTNEVASTPGTAQRFADKMKSILRSGRSEKKEMAPPQSSIPMLSKSPSRPNLQKDLPSVPSTPSGTQVPRTKTSKHVNFTPNTIAKDIADQSPTPLKSGIPRSKSYVNLNSITYPVLPSPAAKAAEIPAIPALDSPDDKPKAAANVSKKLFTEVRAEADAEDTSMTDAIDYPELPQLRETQGNEVKEPAPQATIPGIFTFQHGTQIKFGTPPRKLGFGTSPGQSSIRKVRESFFPHAASGSASASTAAMPGAFPSASSNENKDVPVLTVPHGLSYKKRARAEADEDEDSSEGCGSDEMERSPKKRKQQHVAAEGQMLVAPKLAAEKEKSMAGRRMGSVSPAKGAAKPAKKGGLTMSRLRALATPKKRN